MIHSESVCLLDLKSAQINQSDKTEHHNIFTRNLSDKRPIDFNDSSFFANIACRIIYNNFSHWLVSLRTLDNLSSFCYWLSSDLISSSTFSNSTRWSGKTFLQLALSHVNRISRHYRWLINLTTHRTTRMGTPTTITARNGINYSFAGISLAFSFLRSPFFANQSAHFSIQPFESVKTSISEQNFSMFLLWFRINK